MCATVAYIGHNLMRLYMQFQVTEPQWTNKRLHKASDELKVH